MTKLLFLTMLTTAACGAQRNELCFADRDCASGGSCIDGACVPGPCSGVSCSGRGQCSIVGGAARCACIAGFVPQSLECLPEASGCDGIDCSGHGTCHLVAGEARCDCEQGWATQGLTCSQSPAPTAAFRLSSATATTRDTVVLHAGDSTGFELDFRWDFEDDGVYDTDWSSAAVASCRWHAAADYVVRLQVRDSWGRIATTAQALGIAQPGMPAWLMVLSANDARCDSTVAMTLDGTLIQDAPLRLRGASELVSQALMLRQGSDGDLLAGLWCIDSSQGAECTDDEVASISQSGKSGVWARLPAGFGPAGMVQLPDGSWLVSSAVTGEVLRFPASGAPAVAWADGLSSPRGMTLSGRGTSVLVVEAGRRQVTAFSLAGSRIGRWDEPAYLSNPFELLRLSTGSYLVSDLDGGAAEFDDSGALVRWLLADGMSSSTGLAELPDGRILIGENCIPSQYDTCGSIWVCDRSTDQCSHFASNTQGSTLDHLRNPQGMVVVRE